MHEMRAEYALTTSGGGRPRALWHILGMDSAATAMCGQTLPSRAVPETGDDDESTEQYCSECMTEYRKEREMSEHLSRQDAIRRAGQT